MLGYGGAVRGRRRGTGSWERGDRGTVGGGGGGLDVAKEGISRGMDELEGEVVVGEGGYKVS